MIGLLVSLGMLRGAAAGLEHHSWEAAPEEAGLDKPGRMNRKPESRAARPARKTSKSTVHRSARRNCVAAWSCRKAS